MTKDAVPQRTRRASKDVKRARQTSAAPSDAYHR